MCAQLAPSPPLAKLAARASRTAFVHDGRTIYEWEQSLEEVLVYISPPAGVTASMVTCAFKTRHVTLGLKGVPPFLDEALACACSSGESHWTLDAGELTLTLTKASRGETWPAVFAGHGRLDAAEEAATHKRLLLERFGEEHAGFDFSGADISGTVPDPRSFMGGPGAGSRR